MKLKVKKLVPEASLPIKAKEGDAGYDLTAIDDGEWSKDGTYIQYRTGISIELPEGFHSELFPRSSVTKTDLVLGNGVGLIDLGFRGEIMCRFKVCNRGKRNVHTDGFYDSELPRTYLDQLLVYKKGDKIGQLVIRKTETEFEIQEVDELSVTERGSGGFGSTDNHQK